MGSDGKVSLQLIEVNHLPASGIRSIGMLLALLFGMNFTRKRSIRFFVGRIRAVSTWAFFWISFSALF